MRKIKQEKEKTMACDLIFKCIRECLHLKLQIFNDMAFFSMRKIIEVQECLEDFCFTTSALSAAILKWKKGIVQNDFFFSKLVQQNYAFYFVGSCSLRFLLFLVTHIY